MEAETRSMVTRYVMSSPISQLQAPERFGGEEACGEKNTQ